MNIEIKFRGKSLVDIGNIKKGDWVYGGISYDTDRVWIAQKTRLLPVVKKIYKI